MITFSVFILSSFLSPFLKSVTVHGGGKSIRRFMLKCLVLLQILLISPPFHGFQIPSKTIFDFSKDHNVLVVGDGDLSFGLCLANSGKCRSLTVSTWDSKDKLFRSFPKSESNVLQIEAKSNCRVQYNLDATMINNITEYDLIIWNFPHVVGKQNIRYNRDLLQKFLLSCRDALVQSKGKVIVTLTQKQSGVHAITEEDWNRSWKLVHQVAEAELLLTESFKFDEAAYLGYEPIGHRGYGGRFSYSLPETYLIEFPKSSSVACQAPLYVHEVHLLHDFVIEDLVYFEKRAHTFATQICCSIGFDDALWCLHLVDLYVCPRTSKVSHTIQVRK